MPADKNKLLELANNFYAMAIKIAFNQVQLYNIIREVAEVRSSQSQF